LTDGLRRTADWLARNYDARGDGIRLDPPAAAREAA
jgi:hypothetical protein